MSEKNGWVEFTRFVPGFDFLRTLSSASQQAAQPMPSAFEQWLAPTMEPAEVQKRIDELKVVKFWLEQNGRALEASIQALEVQKMTLSTLRTMNAGACQMAGVLQEGVKDSAAWTGQAFASSMQAAPDRPAYAQAGAGLPPAAAHAQPMQQQALQWWAALSEQFQTIAQDALQDIGRNMEAARSQPGGGPAPAAPQPAATGVRSEAAPGQVRKAAAKRSSDTAGTKPRKRAGGRPGDEKDDAAEAG